MVAYKAPQLVSFLKAPDPRIRAALLYGPDPALVADHAASLTRRFAGEETAETEIVRLDERDLAEAPERLSVEMQTLSMFSARKIVRVRAEARFPVDAVEALLAEPLEAWLIVEAGALRPSAKLRKLFEGSEQAAALPCYELGGRDMAALIDAELEARQVGIEPEARKHLLALFGGDPGRARAETAKLALYVGAGGRAGIEDVEAVIGDVSQAAFDTLCAAAGDRDAGQALRQLDRLVASGQGAQGAIAALGRHFERLHKLCAAAEAGGSVNAVLGGFRPPLHFRQRDTLQAQARRWSRARAESALGLAAQAARAARRRPELERQFAERLLITVSRTR